MSVDIVELPVVTRKQMVHLKQLMIDEFGIPKAQILQRMARHIVQFSSDMLQGDVSRKKICIQLTGGDTGEASFMATKELIRQGAEICLIPVDNPLSCNTDWVGEYGKLLDLSALSDQDLIENFRNTQWDLFINTLTGENFLRSYTDREEQLIEIINKMDYPVLSIDYPLDLIRDIDKRPSFAIRSTATLSFGLPQKELILSESRSQVGALFLADLDIPAALLKKMRLSLGSTFDRNKIINISSDSASYMRDIFSGIPFEKELLGTGKGCLLLGK